MISDMRKEEFSYITKEYMSYLYFKCRLLGECSFDEGGLSIFYDERCHMAVWDRTGSSHKRIGINLIAVLKLAEGCNLKADLKEKNWTRY